MKEQIQQFNQCLIDSKCDITFIDYVKEINKNFFNIDIDFIDDFIELVDKEGFIINHEMLFKYEILAKTSSTNVLSSLERYQFEENIDYVLLRQQVEEGRTEKKNVFMLTTDAFKLLCIRSLKTKLYTQYYILLENASSITMNTKS